MKHLFLYLIFIFNLLSCSKSNKIEGKTFQNLKGNDITLKTSHNKLSVFYFLAPECPLSQNYTKEINEIFVKYKDKEIAFYAVFSGLTYSDDEMKTYIDEYSIQIEGLKDQDYVLANYFKATITPEVFLVDDNENMIYSGKIDNWIESLGVKRQIVTEFYLKDAIEKYLTGKEIIISKTKAVGCVLE